MNVAHNNTIASFITRRRMPPRCSRITHSRPITSKTVPRTVFEVIVITYAYNTNGQLRSTTYPSGNTIAYTYGSPSSINPGKIIGIMLNPTGFTNTANGGSTPTGGVNLITNSDYKPFGPNWGWDWGNSCDTSNPATCTTSTTPRINQHLRQFDLDYRPITIASDPEGYSRNISWDRANRIASINVPSGITIPGITNAQSVNQAFGYDALDRLTNFTPGVTGATTLATGLALLPKEDFTYDAIGNRLTRATQAPGSTATQTANYSYPNTTATPVANRRHILNNIAGAQTNAYAYDASGNTLTESAAQSTMNPATGSMNSSTQALAYTYDAKNRLKSAQIGGNAANTVTYKINAMGQRVQKTGAGAYAFNSSLTIDTATGQSPLARTVNFNARYVYDEQGRLIGEYAPDGKLISETVYFNDLPIVTMRPKGANNGTPLGIAGTTTGNPSNGATAANANNVGNNSTTNRVNVEIFYIHADHLGTPRTVTRSTVATGANAPSSATSTSPGAINKAVWRWDSDPFGTSLDNSKPTENPQLITGTQTVQQAGTFKQNHRFDGQVYDAESGKHYNNMRDGYMPEVGRYSQSDPIGLSASLSTYSYVDSDPVAWNDPFGLSKGGVPGGPPRVIPPILQPPTLGPSPYSPFRMYTGSSTTCGMCFEVYAVLPYRGNSRSWQRETSLEQLYERLLRDYSMRQYFNRDCNCDVLKHMQSGSGGRFLNPPGYELHHPVSQSGVVWLMRRCDHRNPGLQDFLHPNGQGGYFKYHPPITRPYP
jgi:RHS repeat-associated protein